MKIVGLNYGQKVRLTLEDGRSVLVSVSQILSNRRVKLGIEADRAIPVRPARKDEEAAQEESPR